MIVQRSTYLQTPSPAGASRKKVCTSRLVGALDWVRIPSELIRSARVSPPWDELRSRKFRVSSFYHWTPLRRYSHDFNGAGSRSMPCQSCEGNWMSLTCATFLVLQVFQITPKCKLIIILLTPGLNHIESDGSERPLQMTFTTVWPAPPTSLGIRFTIMISGCHGDQTTRIGGEYKPGRNLWRYYIPNGSKRLVHSNLSSTLTLSEGRKES